ncbi:ALG14 [Candida oxycetoniae]|uniref:UDP-N-acetylglucosamine transferase subunit ALG14 n=1 Tax=Candida oxycetoniae TaxID=497107 RepID=A0AAI9SWU2_9ASCO|nr:ALG14 [Candida oxycetoniae]KAI3404329.2 ALG14 [Candida oxycetoniae]
MRSGGHTGEMMKMVSKLNLANLQRTWIYSGRDTASLNQAKSVEQHVYKNDAPVYIRIPRARRVGQSYISSVFTTVYSFVISFIILLFHKPDVLLLNGPGTCIPIAYILFLYKFLGLNTTKIVYIESLARVNKLSLSGRLIMPIADRFIVQWDQLYEKYNRAEYYGILI